MAKEAYAYGKRGLFIWQKRPMHTAKEAYSYGKRGLFIRQKRPIKILALQITALCPIVHLRKVCVSVKRDLFIWQKRPIYMTKEAYAYGKRDLFIRQKRPIYMTTEASCD
jgi:hypothetical protein